MNIYDILWHLDKLNNGIYLFGTTIESTKIQREETKEQREETKEQLNGTKNTKFFKELNIKKKKMDHYSKILNSLVTKDLIDYIGNTTVLAETYKFIQRDYGSDFTLHELIQLVFTDETFDNYWYNLTGLAEDKDNENTVIDRINFIDDTFVNVNYHNEYDVNDDTCFKSSRYLLGISPELAISYLILMYFSKEDVTISINNSSYFMFRVDDGFYPIKVKHM
jgi:hypothetical protein